MGGWLRVWTQPAVHTGMCLTVVTDSPISAEEKKHTSTPEGWEGTKIHSLTCPQHCSPDWKDTYTNVKVHKHKFAFCAVAQACIWYSSNKSNWSKVGFCETLPCHGNTCIVGFRQYGQINYQTISALGSNILQARWVVVPIFCLIIS